MFREEPLLSDTHAHVESFTPAVLDELLERARSQGIATIIANGITLRSSATSVAIAGRYPCLWATVGLHPFYAPRLRGAVPAIRELALKERVVGIGEIGLDFLRYPETGEVQLALFEEQLRLAQELDLPVVIHTKGAHRETLAALSRNGLGEKRVIIQGFRDNLAILDDWLERGFYLSIGGTILWEPSAALAETIRQIPAERLLLETDTTAKRNLSQGLELATLRKIAEKVAELRRVSLEDLARATTKNLREVFRLPDNSNIA